MLFKALKWTNETEYIYILVKCCFPFIYYQGLAIGHPPWDPFGNCLLRVDQRFLLYCNDRH